MGNKKFTSHEMQIAVDEIERLKKENQRLRQNVSCLEKQRLINKNLVDEADDLECEDKRVKKYEYATMLSNGEPSNIHDDGYVDGYHSFRREVGEWEEVEDGK